METTLRLDPISRTAFDARIARLDRCRLTRCAGVTYLDIDRDVGGATHQLALAGIRASWSTVPSRRADLRPAIAFHLRPLDPALGAVDVVELTRIPLSDASSALMRRRLPWLRSGQTERDACLRLLREEDAVIGWRRVVWCTVGVMGIARARIHLRPVVFDRAAVERETVRWIYASEGAIGSWAFT
jgi:hypothetical protein